MIVAALVKICCLTFKIELILVTVAAPVCRCTQCSVMMGCFWNTTKVISGQLASQPERFVTFCMWSSAG